MANPFDSVESYTEYVRQLNLSVEDMSLIRLFLGTKAEEHLIKKRIEAEAEKIELQREFDEDWDRSR